MITYEEALKIAKEKFFHSVDKCEECADCYVFSSKTDGIIDGGGAICERLISEWDVFRETMRKSGNTKSFS